MNFNVENLNLVVRVMEIICFVMNSHTGHFYVKSLLFSRKRLHLYLFSPKLFGGIKYIDTGNALPLQKPSLYNVFYSR